MKANNVSQLTTLLLVTAFSFLSCEDKITIPNKPPFADAGTDMVVVLPEDIVDLDGTSSFDPDGKITKFLWRQIWGANTSMPDRQSSKIRAFNLSPGMYQFELKVTDNGGLSALDTMKVEVMSPYQADNSYYFKNLNWIFPWYATLEIRNIYSYVPQGKPLKVFIQRGSDPTWLEVPPQTANSNNDTYEFFIQNSPNSGIYNYGSLIIFYFGVDTRDTPTVKVEF
jgi:hypothetical protein